MAETCGAAQGATLPGNGADHAFSGHCALQVSPGGFDAAGRVRSPAVAGFSNMMVTLLPVFAGASAASTKPNRVSLSPLYWSGAVEA